MSSSINTNMGSIYAQSNLARTQQSVQSSLEKLSSGYRINSAADDAAGYAISQKMTGQINGLNQASSNAQDAISLIQTGDGALSETSSILQRMRELAVQSASDTNTSSDRTQIQGEVDQLSKEITRISNTTQFNTQNLLAGGFNDTFQIGANQGQNISLNINAMDAQSLGVAGSNVTTTFTGTNSNVASVSTTSPSLNGVFVTKTYTAAANGAAAGSNPSGVGTVAGAFTGSADTTFQFKTTAVSGGVVTAGQYSADGGSTWSVAADTGANVYSVGNGVTIAVATNAANAIGDTQTFTESAAKAVIGLNTLANGTGTAIGSTVTVNNNQSSAVIGDAATGQTATLNFNFATISANAGTTEGDAITQVTQASTAAVTGADGSVTSDAVTQKGIDVSSQSAANLAIGTIDTAINTVSAEQSKLGAMQDRLTDTISNLGTASNNLTSAQSNIQDVNMAAEMSSFTKNQVLAQAGVAMLAQANQAPQALLKLLG